MIDQKSVEILQIIEANGRLDSEKIAKLVDLSVEEVNQSIKELEQKKCDS